MGLLDWISNWFRPVEFPTVNHPVLGRLKRLEPGCWHGEGELQRLGFAGGVEIRGPEDEQTSLDTAASLLEELRQRSRELRPVLKKMLTEDAMTSWFGPNSDLPGIDYPATRLDNPWGGRIQLSSVYV